VAINPSTTATTIASAQSPPMSLVTAALIAAATKNMTTRAGVIADRIQPERRFLGPTRRDDAPGLELAISALRAVDERLCRLVLVVGQVRTPAPLVGGLLAAALDARRGAGSAPGPE
jgi:hypothetical protein